MAKSRGVSLSRKSPDYPPVAAPELKPFSKPQFLMKVETMSMFPNLWEGDLLVCDGLGDLTLEIEQGRDLKKRPLKGIELALWRIWENHYVVLEVNGERWLKRLAVQLSEENKRGTIVFETDNVREYGRGIILDRGDFRIRVCGIVSWYIPLDRNPERLSKDHRSEWRRLGGR